jgi:hypothetical protein
MYLRIPSIDTKIFVTLTLFDCFLQSLTPVGTPIAWLFAKPIEGAKNGFALTGGVFNYTAVVKFPQTGHSTTVKLRFTGMDAFDYLKGKKQFKAS